MTIPSTSQVGIAIFCDPKKKKFIPHALTILDIVPSTSPPEPSLTTFTKFFILEYNSTRETVGVELYTYEDAVCLGLVLVGIVIIGETTRNKTFLETKLVGSKATQPRCDWMEEAGMFPHALNSKEDDRMQVDDAADSTSDSDEGEEEAEKVDPFKTLEQQHQRWAIDTAIEHVITCPDVKSASYKAHVYDEMDSFKRDFDCRVHIAMENGTLEEIRPVLYRVREML